MKKILLFLFKSACALGLFIGLQQVIELKTRGFYLQKIVSDDLYDNPDWDVSIAAEQEQAVLRTLNQPFTFLGAGSEAFAFLSADEQYVLKFFKLDAVRPVYVLRGLFAEDHSSKAGTLSSLYTQCENLPWRLDAITKRVLGMREYRIGRTFYSLKRAYDNLREETGLMYLHLNPTSHIHQKLILYDPNGIAHQIDADTSRFYVQKRAIPLEKHFLALKKNQEHERAKKSIASLCRLIVDRCRKGFADRDPYNKNFGFIDDRAIEIDTGSFIPDSQMKEPFLYKRELLFVTLELRKWAKYHYPELLDIMTSEIQKEIGCDASSCSF